MNSSQPNSLMHTVLPGVLAGIIVPLTIIATIGFERPFWQLLIFGGAIGAVIGLAFRMIRRG